LPNGAGTVPTTRESFGIELVTAERSQASRRSIALDDLDLGTVKVVQHLPEIAHVEPLIATWTFHEMVGFGLSDAIGVDAVVAGQGGHRRPAFGFSPSSLHFRSTSSTDPDWHKVSAASWIVQPLSIAALRSSMSISVQSLPS
jgi:hypothetical protein